MKKIIWVAVALVAAMILSATPVMAAHNQLLCVVDIGDEASEGARDMDANGWGPIEPDTHGGNWGGIGIDEEENESIDRKCRVIWPAGEYENTSATITLDRCCKNGAVKTIVVRHLDGTADDSFTVEVKDNHGQWVKIGEYIDEPEANDEEEWHETRFELPNGRKLQLGRGLEVEIKLTATSTTDPAWWSGFDTYGQVAFDWIKLEGNAGNCNCNCGNNFCWRWRWGFNWMKNFGKGGWWK